jgi:tetrahydromethanopterin S-methyltransferase subunit F
MSSWSVTYLSLLINRNARAVSSEILSRKRGVFFGFVLLLLVVVGSSFENLATSL